VAVKAVRIDRSIEPPVAVLSVKFVFAARPSRRAPAAGAPACVWSGKFAATQQDLNMVTSASRVAKKVGQPDAILAERAAEIFSLFSFV
jgi:hypothetical protein